jgi:hypothetical protein
VGDPVFRRKGCLSILSQLLPPLALIYVELKEILSILSQLLQSSSMSLRLMESPSLLSILSQLLPRFWQAGSL